jgi:hypothetical protein
VGDAKGPNGVVESKARKEALTLTLSPLPIHLDVMHTSHEIYKIMEGANVRNIYFHKERLIVTMVMQMYYVLTLLSIGLLCTKPL